MTYVTNAACIAISAGSADAQTHTVELLKKFAAYTDEQLARLNRENQHGAGKLIMPKRVSAPVLEWAIEWLPHLDRSLQQKLLEIRRMLISLKEGGEDIRAQNNLALSTDRLSLSQAIRDNIGLLGRQWLATAKHAADDAQAVVLSLRPGA